mmetsp:Transcript_32546/g.37126  ORF Transcript_32546/g.37126 Transcript_32546/m.37126 type:complete len:107 (-) Transcript_32546:20-340(-)
MKEYCKFVKSHHGLIKSVNGAQLEDSFMKMLTHFDDNMNYIEQTFQSDSSLIDAFMEELTRKTKFLYSIVLMLKISELGHGVGFGELALLHSKPRSATIIAKEDTW